MKIQIFKKEDFTEVYLPYIPKVIGLIKAIDGAKYSTQPVKKWSIPTGQLTNLVTILEQNNVEIDYLSEAKILQDISNKENIKSVQISMDDLEFNIKLPVPSNLYGYLFNTPKRTENKTYIINNQHFPQFFSFCSSSNIDIVMN